MYKSHTVKDGFKFRGFIMKIISIKKLSITILLSILVAAPLMAKDKTVAAPEVTIQKVVINPTETTTGKVIEAATLIAQDCTMSTLQGLVALVQQGVDFNNLGNVVQQTLQYKLYEICSFKDLITFKALTWRQTDLFTKMPYVLLKVVNKFTDKIQQQMKDREHALEEETYSYMQKAVSIVKSASGSAKTYISEAFEGKESFNADQSTNLDDLIKVTQYPKLKQALFILVQSQIKNLNPHIPSEIITQEILTEDNLVTLFDEALLDALRNMLTTKEVTLLVNIIKHPVFTQIIKYYDYVAKEVFEAVKPLLSPSWQVVAESALVKPIVDAFTDNNNATAAAAA